MRKPISSREPRGPWLWRLQWVLIVAAIGILIALFAVLRRGQEAPKAPVPSDTDAPER